MTPLLSPSQRLPTLAASIISQQPDEDFINKSLLDSLDAQADAEPISSSDSEQAPRSYGSASNSSSGGGSPAIPYHLQMHAHHSQLTLLDSTDTLNHQHIPSHDSMYLHQNPIFLPDGMHSMPDFVAEHESRKYQQQTQSKLDNLNNSFRNNLNHFNQPRTRHQTSRSALPTNNSFRDTQQYFPPSAPEVFSPIMTSPVQQHISAFEPRPSFDFNSQINLTNIASKPYMDAYSQNVHPSHQANGNKTHQQQSQHPSYSAYPSVPHLSSQTPYGPHVPTPQAGPSNNSGAPLAAPPAASSGNAAGPPSNEEISTIFVVGFPEDMQEREFQNMFTFSPDFEAATLKIPNKEFTAYGGTAGSGTMGTRNGYSYSGANDPYNIVTVNQGGVVIDGGRDGTTTSWPANMPGDELNGPFGAAGNSQGAMPPRKQIIGFAKFRTRDAALLARDGLQGRRVDIDKGAVLKAEMAKKNLHTKRGVGPVPSSTTSTSTGTANGAASSTPGLQQALGNTAAGSEGFNIGQNEALSPKDRDITALNSIPLSNGRVGHWREQQQQDHMHLNSTSGISSEDEERRALLSNIGTYGTRGPRERAEDDERERRRRDKDVRLRAGNMSAYEAFHSVPAGPAGLASLPRSMPGNGTGILVADQDIATGTSPLTNGFVPSRSLQQNQEEMPGPWDHIRSRGVAIPRAPSQRSVSPPLQTNGAVFDTASQSFSPPEPHQFVDQPRHDPQFNGLRNHASSESSSSSVVGGLQTVGVNDGQINESDLSRALGGLDLNTDGGKTSPQLPSPASGASSRNGVDQNPPINTLYVGNLPTSSPNGFPQDFLEESLRELFTGRAGFRRLCFRYKSNGPMCFVEFEDVPYATKALNELYGDTLNGLVKGGIRLSYSKNPLGVRTPTSASSGAPSFQQQQMQNNSGPPSVGTGQEFMPRKDDQQSRLPAMILRRESSVISPPPPSVQSPFAPELMGSSPPPPPRFFSSSPHGFAASSGANLTGVSKASFTPRYGFGLQAGSSHGPSSTFSPFGLSSTPPPHSTIPDLQPDGHPSSHPQHFHHNFAPASNLEAARAS
ncbi:hypothetical protein H0H92_011131 [Tricholoma furcatifolium]|nr:hypothetical protein H0H92_011131 [Tricholoma furcatifolium]